MNNNIITVSKEELCDILEVSSKALQHIITRKQLSDRLQKAGYILIAEYRIGKAKAYDIQQTTVSEWSKLQMQYNIKKEEEHTLYSFVRLTNLKEPRTKLLNNYKIDISGTTAKRWDDVLIEEKAMEEESEVYYKIDNNGNWEEITKEGYNAFWVECKEYKYIVSIYRTRLNKNEITNDTYDLVINNLYNTIERFKGYMVVRFKTYKEAENTKFVLDMINNRKLNAIA